MTKEQAVVYLRFSGFSDEQIKAIEGAFTCEDAISRQAVLDSIHANCVYENEYNLTAKHIEDAVKQLPPVNPQEPICPSAGIDCEDCPAYEDVIRRKAVLNTLENMDRALDEDRTVENYKDLLRECYKVLPSVKPRSEWEHDHEILKAYSDGANAVLDNVRAEIEQAYCKVTNDYDHGRNYGLYMAIQIIDSYKAEGSDKE